MLVKNIQEFLRFANFCQRFIQSLNWIATLLTSMLKTIFTTSAGTLPKAADNSNILTHNTRLAFLWLGQAFTKAFILHHFDPQRYIQKKTDASGYAIGDILSQFISDSGQWYLEAFSSIKMIPAETCYKTHNQKLLAMVEAFKTCCHYLKDCKFERLVKLRTSIQQ